MITGLKIRTRSGGGAGGAGGAQNLIRPNSRFGGMNSFHSGGGAPAPFKSPECRGDRPLCGLNAPPREAGVQRSAGRRAARPAPSSQ
ncbi:hypothetical protein EVAR_35321_1 [Eumeta japonica]|uniref:Uncharacterized protein n=1 Tax=Eumeta variegata TaxID=151549 RepID=A0A4C1XHK1_EUMVA|nr:hypothetical protein EVAR_35321_1 [Eumeta japonica]